MGLAQDIESKIREAVAANELLDYATAETKLRSAIFLMAGHPRIRFEESETEYVHDDLVAMLKDVEKKQSQQTLRNNSAGGFVGVPIRNRIV